MPPKRSLALLGAMVLFFAVLGLVLKIYFSKTGSINDTSQAKSVLASLFKNNQDIYKPPDYVFPEESSNSDGPVPPRVIELFGSTININVRFYRKDYSYNKSGQLEPMGEGSGSGFMAVKPGIFVSARHTFLATINYMLEEKRIPFSLDRNGLPISNYYDYKFFGTAEVKGRAVTFPLELVAMGEPLLGQDFAIFKTLSFPPELAVLEFEETSHRKDLVYSAGRVPVFKPIDDDINFIKKLTQMDFINHIFTGRINEVLTNMPLNRESKLKKIYRIQKFLGNIEPGFSGGPVLNQDGKVIGMSIMLGNGTNFSYAISATDLKLFIQKLQNKGIIPK